MLSASHWSYSSSSVHQINHQHIFTKSRRIFFLKKRKKYWTNLFRQIVNLRRSTPLRRTRWSLVHWRLRRFRPLLISTINNQTHKRRNEIGNDLAEINEITLQSEPKSSTSDSTGNFLFDDDVIPSKSTAQNSENVFLVHSLASAMNPRPGSEKLNTMDESTITDCLCLSLEDGHEEEAGEVNELWRRFWRNEEISSDGEERALGPYISAMFRLIIT